MVRRNIARKWYSEKISLYKKKKKEWTIYIHNIIYYLVF